MGKARVYINEMKLRFLFGEMNADKMGWVKKMLEKFYELSGLDSKPEKGERKMADELALLISHLIELQLKQEYSKELMVFKMLLLE